LPNATLSEYDGEPHGLFITAADRLNEELAEFISGRSNKDTEEIPLPLTDRLSAAQA
jgi:hypothetical protein